MVDIKARWSLVPLTDTRLYIGLSQVMFIILGKYFPSHLKAQVH